MDLAPAFCRRRRPRMDRSLRRVRRVTKLQALLAATAAEGALVGCSVDSKLEVVIKKTVSCHLKGNIKFS